MSPAWVASRARKEYEKSDRSPNNVLTTKKLGKLSANVPIRSSGTFTAE